MLVTRNPILDFLLEESYYMSWDICKLSTKTTLYKLYERPFPENATYVVTFDFQQFQTSSQGWLQDCNTVMTKN